MQFTIKLSQVVIFKLHYMYEIMQPFIKFQGFNIDETSLIKYNLSLSL